MTAYEKLLKCAASVREKTDFIPEIALVLGSGLGSLAELIEDKTVIGYSDIEGFPASTVAGHAGRLIFGRLSGKKIMCMQGRVHYYEGYGISDVVLGVRLSKMLGAETLVLTNAAGGVAQELSRGDLMLIRDHTLMFFPENPLRGENIAQLGVRFPDMSDAYDPSLCELLKSCAASLGINLFEGVYAQLQGPSYETAAEVRMLRSLGVDAVGMSTAVETVAARHAGLRVCAVSCIANKAVGLTEEKLTHEDVQKAADETGEKLAKLLKLAIGRM